jgi:FkbM family methyltransferase
MFGKHTLQGLEAIFAFDNWPMLFLGRVFDRKTGFVAYRKKGFDILVDHRSGDQCGTRMCIATDMYRKYLPSFELTGPIRVLDLGANGGGFPLMLSIAGIELERAVCVEMNPLTFHRLQLNLATNLGDKAVAINAAVCAMPQDTEILMRPTRGGTGDSIYHNSIASVASSQVSVHTTTLQALYDRYFEGEFIDLCKIDIEGEEFDILAAASDELLCKIRHLIMEIHYFREDGAAKARVLLDRFAGLGFVDITIEEDARSHSTVAEVRAFRGPEAKSVSIPSRSAA